MNKKILGVLVCILFFGVSIVPSISGNIRKLVNISSSDTFEDIRNNNNFFIGASDIEWYKVFNRSVDDWAYCLDQTTDGGYIISGETKVDNSRDAWLIKTDANGNEGPNYPGTWNKTFGGQNKDWGWFVQQTSDNEYIMTGSTASYGAVVGCSEKYEFWVDHVRFKCEYEYDYPDLTVEDIWIEPSNFDPGDYVTLKAIVKNIGVGDIYDTFYVLHKFNGEDQGAWTVSGGLPAGESYLCWIPFNWPQNCDENTIEIIADISDVIDESNENNNDRTEGFSANCPTICFYTNPSNCGSITFDEGTFYNEDCDVVPSGSYSIYANPCSGYVFSHWSYTGGVSVNNPNSQSTNVTITDTGTLTAHFDPPVNNPPYAPTDPIPEDGETDVYINTDISWTCSDPDGDDITYDVFFGASTTPPLVSNNQTISSYDPGIMNYFTLYYWQIIAWDPYGEFNTSPIWSFTTCSEPNNPPNPPIIDGPTSGKTGVMYDFTFVAVDPDGDDLYYYIDWGDGTTEEWIGPYFSDEEITRSHSWNKGKFTIRARVKDTGDLKSDWIEFEVTMPRDTAINNPFLQFIPSHPNLFPLLQKLFLLIN